MQIASASALAASRAFPALLPWLALLLVLIVAGAVVMLIVRRLATNDSHPPSAGFTLHDLRRMRETGDLSEEEFERARAAMIDRVKGENTSTPGSRGGDAGEDR